jgi:hypothetical protein
MSINYDHDDYDDISAAAKADYEAASLIFSSNFPPDEEEGLKDLMWDSINAATDAMEAGVAGIETRLRAAAFVLRRYAIGRPTCIGSDRAWDELLASARAARTTV